MINKIRKFLNKNDNLIKRGAKFGVGVLNDASMHLYGDVSYLDYVTFLFKLKTNYDEELKETGWKSMGRSWEKCIFDVLGNGIIPLVKMYEKNIIQRGDLHFVINPEFTLGWVETNENVASIYCEKGQKELVWDYLKKIFWSNYDGLVISADIKSHRISFDKEVGFGVLDSVKATEIATNLKKFIDKGHSRSILLHGKPGTGKSNIVRSIGKILGYQGFKIEYSHLASLDMPTIQNLLNVLEPSIVIIEDIDHAEFGSNSVILGVMEILNKSGKLLLATCNDSKLLEDASIRPGRFDELIEIKEFDSEILKGIIGDEVLYERFKTYPIASVMEIMKRIDVFGKEEGLKRIGDVEERVKRMEEN